MTATAYCRVCFEKEQNVSKLISPCSCRGTSLHIHIHCLELWQTLSLQNNNPIKAFYCPVCLARYCYPSMLTKIYQGMAHILYFCHRQLCEYLLEIFFKFFMLPLKVIVHTSLVIIIILFGEILIASNQSLVWVDSEFPPYLVIIETSPSASTSTSTAPSGPIASDETMMVSNQDVSQQSPFHQPDVVLVVGQSRNTDSHTTSTHHHADVSVIS
jgi:E3 ubiquitin-protein ligase DOA10